MCKKILLLPLFTIVILGVGAYITSENYSNKARLNETLNTGLLNVTVVDLNGNGVGRNYRVYTYVSGVEVRCFTGDNSKCGLNIPAGTYDVYATNDLDRSGKILNYYFHGGIADVTIVIDTFY